MARSPDGFYKKNGKTVPRHDPKGKGGVTLLAIGLAAAVGAGAIGAGASSFAGGTAARGGTSSNSTISERDSLRAVARLERQGFRIISRLDVDETDCAGRSYGKVQQFFQGHPCTSLHRALFEVRDKQGHVVLVAVAWVQMPDVSGADALKKLVDGHGTGNITELSRERGRYRAVRFTGTFYASDQTGSAVVNAQAQPVARGPAGLVLTAIVTNAVR